MGILEPFQDEPADSHDAVRPARLVQQRVIQAGVDFHLFDVETSRSKNRRWAEFFTTQSLPLPRSSVGVVDRPGVGQQARGGVVQIEQNVRRDAAGDERVARRTPPPARRSCVSIFDRDVALDERPPAELDPQSAGPARPAGT